MKIAVILNPHALGVQRDPGLVQRLERVLGRAGEVVVTQSPDELGQAMQRLRRQGVEWVATCGGDGTNLSTLTALIRAYGPERLPRFALLRGGTVNTVARNLGIHGRPDLLLARLIARGEATPTVEQDLLSVNGCFGFLFASLMGARFLEAYYHGPHLGPAWAGLLAARTAASSLVQGPFARWLFSPEELSLLVDGEVIPAQPYRLLVAAVVQDVGIGMRVTWRAGTAPRRFHLVASGLSTPAMALQLPRVLSGRPLRGQPHLDRLAEAAHLRFTAPQSYTLDGDLFRAAEVSLAAGPRIRIARP